MTFSDSRRGSAIPQPDNAYTTAFGQVLFALHLLWFQSVCINQHQIIDKCNSKMFRRREHPMVVQMQYYRDKRRLAQQWCRFHSTPVELNMQQHVCYNSICIVKELKDAQPKPEPHTSTLA